MADKIKYEREKHKKLVNELKSTRSKGEKNLLIQNGSMLHQYLDSKYLQINNLVMGQVIHPWAPDAPPDEVPIDKKQNDIKQRAISSNSPLVQIHLILIIEIILLLGLVIMMLPHTIYWLKIQIKQMLLVVTGITGHNKLKILSLNCGSIRSQAKKNSLAVLLNEHDIDIVLGCGSHIFISLQNCYHPHILH